MIFGRFFERSMRPRPSLKISQDTSKRPHVGFIFSIKLDIIEKASPWYRRASLLGFLEEFMTSLGRIFPEYLLRFLKLYHKIDSFLLKLNQVIKLRLHYILYFRIFSMDFSCQSPPA